MRLSLDRAIVHSLLLVSAFAGCREPSGAAPLLVASTTAAPNTLAASWELALDRCNGALARADHAEAERACDDALARSEAFGAGDRKVEAYVMAVARQETSDFYVKPVAALLDETPVLRPDQLRLAAHMRRRYACTYGDALQCMIPAGIAVRTERFVEVAAGTGSGPSVALATMTFQRSLKASIILSSIM